ncbi:hypothetical protein H4R27_002374 [Coemansia aciculifera]|nr:hypothetical protein H4R27_002374 [Coemansia aciculifera]
MSPAPADPLGRWININGDGGIVRYVGPVDGGSGTWLGVEWTDTERGKHNGSKDGKQYFKCKSTNPKCASFIRCVDRIDWGQTLIEAARSRYIVEIPEICAHLPQAIDGRRGKIEAVGFEKIAREQSDLSALQVLGLDSLKVYGLGTAASVLANVKTLLLSRNYLTGWRQVKEILEALPNVDVLDISGNHFDSPLFSGGEDGDLSVGTLRIDSSPGLTWLDVCGIAERVHARCLSFGWSELSLLPVVSLDLLEDLSLEYNHISDILPLSHLPRLRSLNLRGNAELTGIPEIQGHMFSCLESLNLGYTGISSWRSVNNLGTLPLLRTLYLGYTPVVSAGDDSVSRALVIGRLANISKLDGTLISAEERTEMERYYLVLSMDDGSEFPRLPELIAKHGAPRRPAVVEAKIKSRLVSVTIQVVRGPNVVSETAKSLLKSMLVRQLKPIVMRLAGAREFQLYVNNDDLWVLLDCDTRSLDFYGVENDKVIRAVLQ